MRELYGVTHVAKVLGVQPSLVCNWMRRYDNTPAPYAMVTTGNSSAPAWDAAGVQRWVKWNKARMGARADKLRSQLEGLQSRLAEIEERAA